MTPEQEDALLAFLRGLAVTNVDIEAFDALVASFGRTHPKATTVAAYEDAVDTTSPAVAPVEQPEAAEEPVEEPVVEEDAPEPETEPAVS